MKGYIKRLSRDIEKLVAKRQALSEFIQKPREEIDNKQFFLLAEQNQLMEKLEDVMKRRLDYEKEIHPDYFEDLQADEDPQTEFDFDDEESDEE